jgi:AcrR family transcriptional regulator
MAVKQTIVRGNNAGGRETRELLVRTAERLFAEQGIDAVSLRAISAAAGLRMAGAVAYHFGDRDGLIRAIIDDRTVRIDERSEPLLDALERTGRGDDVRAVTEAVIRPAAGLIGETGHYFRFLAQLDRHPGTMMALQDTDAFKSTRRIIALQDAAAARHLPPRLVEHRRRLATHVVVGALADLEAGGEPADEALVTDLVDCVVALFTAPATG